MLKTKMVGIIMACLLLGLGATVNPILGNAVSLEAKDQGTVDLEVYSISISGGGDIVQCDMRGDHTISLIGGAGPIEISQSALHPLFKSIPKGVYEVKGTHGVTLRGSTTVDLTNMPDGGGVQVILAQSFHLLQNPVSLETKDQGTVDLDVYFIDIDRSGLSGGTVWSIWSRPTEITISLIGGEFSRSIGIGRSDSSALFESVPKGVYEVKGTYGKWIYKGTGSTTVDLTNIPNGARVQVILAASENAVSPEAEEQGTVDLEVYPTIRSEDELTPIWGDITISLIGGEFSRSIEIGRLDPDPSALFESIPKGVYEVKGTSGKWISKETGKTTVDLTNMPDGGRVQVIILARHPFLV